VASRGRSQVPVTDCRAWGQARIKNSGDAAHHSIGRLSSRGWRRGAYTGASDGGPGPPAWGWGGIGRGFNRAASSPCPLPLSTTGRAQLIVGGGGRGSRPFRSKSEEPFQKKKAAFCDITQECYNAMRPAFELQCSAENTTPRAPWGERSRLPCCLLLSWFFPPSPFLLIKQKLIWSSTLVLHCEAPNYGAAFSF
jgi:hypothetical protein